jgi:hypothetical protein
MKMKCVNVFLCLAVLGTVLAGCNMNTYHLTFFNIGSYRGADVTVTQEPSNQVLGTVPPNASGYDIIVHPNSGVGTVIDLWIAYFSPTDRQKIATCNITGAAVIYVP